MRASYRVVRTEPVWCNHAIDEWRRRLSACVDAEGRHFEHYLWLLYSQKTMSKWKHYKFDNWRWLSVLFCCERKWTKNNSTFNWSVVI